MNRRYDDTLHDDGFIVVPDGEEVWPHVKEAAGGIIPDAFTELDEEGNVFDGECQPGVVRYHQVEVEGWKIVAHLVEAQSPHESTRAEEPL